MILAKRRNGIFYIQFFDNEEQKIKRVSTSSRNKKDALLFLNNFSESLKSEYSKKIFHLLNFKMSM